METPWGCARFFEQQEATQRRLSLGETETLYWLDGPRALVAGDVLMGDPLRLCPDSWLPEELRGAPIRDSLRPLLDLPIERILTAHGEPVLSGGHDLLAGLLD